jgi:hypothetical protein
MPSRELDPETLREVFVYLYRCWLLTHFGELPERLGLSATDGALISQGLSLYYSTQPVADDAIADLERRLRKPLFLFAPSLPKDTPGATSFDQRPDLPTPLSNILALINKNWAWLETHKERALMRNEAYERLDHGKFAIWRGKAAARLILYPEATDAYGYVVVRNGPRDYFLKKSKSCNEEGERITEGQYKRTQHREEKRSSINFDLLMRGGEVLLLRLVLAGAGYKAFPRQTPEPEYDGL